MGFNVAELLPRAAEQNPSGPALIYRPGGWVASPSYAYMSFRELDERADAYARGLAGLGLERGQRVLMLVPQSPEFVALTFAVFKVGALPVMIDPGMGPALMFRCIAQARPEALIGIRKAHVARSLVRAPFATVRLNVSTDGLFPGAIPLSRLADRSGPFDAADTEEDEPAAILFTSGSTGPPKGVVYRHRIFRAQVELLRDTFGFTPGEVDMPGFPLFALFSTALGLTVVLPELDPSRPARCRPEKLVQAIQQWKVNNLHGSPAIWQRVGEYCREHQIRLPSVKRVLTFGASIPPDLLRTWADILPEASEVYTPYGATEALPVACITGREVLSQTSLLSAAGAGTCVGQPVPGVEVRILAITDDPIPTWRDDLVLPQGQFGEVAVCGDVVTWAYDGLLGETERAKIRDGERIWHRMGDMGYLDEQGRLWVLGRKSHRVEGRNQRYFPDAAEGMVNPHPRVARSALVGVGQPGQQEPVLVVEPRDREVAYDAAEQKRLTPELLDLMRPHPLYRDVKTVLYHGNFPVDRRHNAKIHREELARWASKRLGVGA
ncbi:MAG: fatty acid CoA ligase family protein [Candidatus Eremiobacterota bacterium]